MSRMMPNWTHTGVCETNYPWMPAFALQSGSINCSPGPDLVLSKLNLSKGLIIRRSVLFTATGRLMLRATAEAHGRRKL